MGGGNCFKMLKVGAIITWSGMGGQNPLLISLSTRE